MELQDKKAFRKQMVAKRDELSEEYRKKADEKRNSRLMQETWFREAEVMLFYVSFRSEADTRGLLREALAAGKTVGVPKVDGKNMDFFRITSMEQLVEGYQGILEPQGSCEGLDEAVLTQSVCRRCSMKDEKHKVILFVPGCAFDVTGGRMGYGGGFYDRFMERYPELLRVAPAYQLQMVPEVPREVHDKPVDIIVTEANTFYTRP